MRHREKLIPMVVALPLFLQNVDSSILGTALPTIAQSLQVHALDLNLAITAYLISLAVFLPASGWIADRYGARRVFCAAIALFSFASALCGLANSLETLVACRVLQGLGGAMMVPVGRLILLRSVAPRAMVTAMIWFTMPPVFGRLLGPVVGGVAVTWFSWRWIFLINVPLGILGIVLALVLLDADGPPERPPPFDAIGFFLMGAGLASLLASLETAASPAVARSISMVLAVFALACLAGYGVRSRRIAAPLIDLGIVRFRSFNASVIGGLPLRLAVGALPFLMPLMFQLGFGLSPLDSGLLTVGTAVGALATRGFLARVIGRYGFRSLLLGATVCSSLSFCIYASLTATTPHVLLFVALVAGGLATSSLMVSLTALAFAEVPKRLQGQATALSTMAQQLSFSLGVLLAVELLRVSVWRRQGDPSALLAGDFTIAFVAFAAVILVSLYFFKRLPMDIGAEFRDG